MRAAPVVPNGRRAQRTPPAAQATPDAAGAVATAPLLQEHAAPAEIEAQTSVERFTDERVSDLFDSFIADLARLRARAAEQLEAEAEAVLRDLAERVLARELELAPIAVEALIADAADAFARAGVRVVVRTSETDVNRIGGCWPLEVDASLRAGDFSMDVDGGRFDASLQTRLEAMLASHRVAL